MNFIEKSVTSELVKSGMQKALASGIGPRDFEKITGITKMEANRSDGRISASKYIAMLNLIERLPDPINLIEYAVFNFSSNAFFNTIATVKNSPDLDTAFKKCIELRPLIGEVDSMLYKQSDCDFEFRFVLEGGGRTPLMAMNSFEGLIVLAEYYGGEKVHSPVIELVGKEEPSWKKLIIKTGCKVTFGNSANRLTFKSPYAKKNFDQHNRFIYQTICNRAHNEIGEIRSIHSFGAKIENYLNKLMTDKTTPFAERKILALICEYFSLSRSAIHRRLQKENSTFQGILNRVRVNEAKRLLLLNSIPLNEVSESLGFSSHAVFSRFFSDSVGISPSRFKLDNKA